MIIENTAIEHAFNQLSRDLNEEFPDTSLLFICHQPQEQSKALQAREEDIKEIPGGKALLAALKQRSSLEPVVMKTFTRPFPFLIQKPSFIGLCFIDTAALKKNAQTLFETEEDSHKDAKLITMQRAWPLLSLWLEAKADHHKNTGQQIFTPPADRLKQIRNNLLADCFASIALQLADNQNTAGLLQKHRGEKALSALHHNTPEQDPFAITFDAVKLVVRYAQEQAQERKFFHNTLTATMEISEVFDDIALEKWIEFAQKAQEMLWAGYSVSETLGAATYSTEDPHLRSYASIIAELLNQDVSPVKPGSGYNPFANQASTEQAHIKAAENLFPELIDRVLVEEKPEILLHEAHEQNAKLLRGKIIGWCAPALIDAYNSYKSETQDTAELGKKLNLVFHDTLRSIKWSDIQKLNTLIMHIKREHEHPSLGKIKERLEASETLSRLTKYL